MRQVESSATSVNLVAGNCERSSADDCPLAQKVGEQRGDGVRHVVASSTLTALMRALSRYLPGVVPTTRSKAAEKLVGER